MPTFRKTLIASATACLLWGSLLPATAQTSASPPAPAAPNSVMTKEADNLWTLGNVHAASSKHSRQQWMMAVLRRNPDAFLLGNIHRLRSQVMLQLPSEAEVAAENLAAAEALLLRHFAAVDSNQPMPVLPRQAAAGGVPAPQLSPAPAANTASAAAPAPAPAAAQAPTTAAPTPAAPAAAATASAGAAETVASAPAASAVVPATGADAAAARGAVPTARAPEGAPVTAPAGDGVARWLPQGLAVILALSALGIVWRARRSGQPLGRSMSTLFQDTIQLIQRSRPKVVTVSHAAAEMARSVEQLGGTDQLVASGALRADIDVSAVPQEPAMKLALARAQIEIGRTDAATAILRAVLREGAAAERDAAAHLLGRLGAA